MKSIKKYSFEEWKNKYENKISHSCGVHFEDGYVGTFLNLRGCIIKNEIESLIKEHSCVSYIATNK